MKIKIISVGKVKNNNIKREMEELLKRLAPFCSVSLQELKDEGKKKESERMLLLMKNNHADLFILDACGKNYSSEEFSEFLKEELKEKTEIVFIIGGPDGIEENVKKKARTISLSRMTFTHEMSRLILLEQIYRAFMIQSNRPYHK
jgi:23S rRNA (pseudouridine1915-N3)-methyltransferase